MKMQVGALTELLVLESVGMLMSKEIFSKKKFW